MTGSGAAAGSGGVPQTASRYGLVSGDHGYSFLDGGKLMFLFGDAAPMMTFPLGSTISNLDRWPYDSSVTDPRSFGNDAIATASSVRPAFGCPTLTFDTQTPPSAGVPEPYANPHVIIRSPGGPGNEVSLRDNESPVSGIVENGTTYVIFKTDNPETSAKALFDDPTPCAAELGVEYGASIQRWMMLYNCKDHTRGHPAGIWMRTAPNPWGPWSAATTILNPDPSTHLGYCWLIHQLKGCPPHAPNPPKSSTTKGTYYGPYFVAPWTTSTSKSVGTRSTGVIRTVTTTFYYTLDTFSPYGQWIMRSRVSEAVQYTPPIPPVRQPGCGTKCV